MMERDSLRCEIIYSASYETLAGLVKFLMEDCCAAHPAIRENVEKSDGCCIPDDEVASA
jgi:ArsR family transcriptional regulator, arsenate/arsenite/antimonite-responsive transcriptional repressor